MREIKFYENESGEKPVEIFLAALPSKLRQKTTWVLKVVRDMFRVSTEYLKKLQGTDNIWEIRVTHGKDSIRLLGFWDGNTMMILTNGFMKKTDKIPQREIDLAEQRKNNYLKRKAHG